MASQADRDTLERENSDGDTEEESGRKPGASQRYPVAAQK